ncbi:hypothetical protein BDV23DRAFT_145656 [Aspergillus alliaceus]|uniref:LYR family protein n=1 Tax=Petromyces alliaceus TaxID=209559 RepID=A0A5N7CM52_PETAA|nr:hypothetical protein BDV23DRAFT_145656 [Aspergillus alliaceus]
MPPTFRSSRSGRQFGDGANRTRTGQIDHDVFEGLPVRRWTRQLQTVSQTPKLDGQESFVEGPGGKQTIPEHPMPKDSHLLTPMSRALLRAARAGCIYIRKAPKDVEDEEKEVMDVEEQPTLQTTERSFVTRKWTTVPRHLENPEVEFLAKRRPGLPSLYGAMTAGANGAENGSAPMRRTRFKKVDPRSGNISVYEAWVPEGHKIEGEITDDSSLIPENGETTVTPEAPAPGTVIEGVGVVNGEGVVVADPASAAVMTPPKRRPPPPKRKAKGFGKGRRKKVMFAPGEGADANAVHGAGAADVAAETGYSKEGADRSRISNGQDDEDDDGDDGEESDEGDESMLDAKTPETPLHQPSAEPPVVSAPGPVADPIPTSTAPTTETVVASQPPAATSEPPSHLPLQSSAMPTMPFTLQQPLQPVQPTTRILGSNSPENLDLKVPPAEDVEMTGVHPELPSVDAHTAFMPKATPNTQQQVAPDIIRASSVDAVTKPQENPQVPAPGPSLDVKKEESTETPLEIPSTGQAISVAQTGVEDMDVKLDPSATPTQAPPGQASQPEQVPQPQQTPQPEQARQPEQVPQLEIASHSEPAREQLIMETTDDMEESNGTGLLDSLEASLGRAPSVGPNSALFDAQIKAHFEDNAAQTSTEITQEPSMNIGVDTIGQSKETALQSVSPQSAEPTDPVVGQPSAYVPKQFAVGHSEEQAAESPTEQHMQHTAEPPIKPSIEQAPQELEQSPVEQPTEPTMEQTEMQVEELTPVSVEKPLEELQGVQQIEAEPDSAFQRYITQDTELTSTDASEPPAASFAEPPREIPAEQLSQPTEHATAQPSVTPPTEQVVEQPDISQPAATQPLQPSPPPQQQVEHQPPQVGTPHVPTATGSENPQPDPIQASETHDFTAPNFSPISDLNPEPEKKEETDSQPKTVEARGTGEPVPSGHGTVPNPQSN